MKKVFTKFLDIRRCSRYYCSDYSVALVHCTCTGVRCRSIPMPCIAAILFMVAYNMCGWRTFVGLCKSAPKSDITVFVLTFALTVIFDPDSISLRAVPDHTLVYEVSGPMFFGAADKILKISVKEDTQFLIIRMRSVNAIDATAMHSLEQLYESFHAKGILE